MKQLFCFVLIFLFLSNIQVNGQSYNIVETINDGLYHFNGEVQTGLTIYHELVIVAIDSCSYSQSTLPTWFNQNYTKVHEFFDAATFGQFNYAVNWLTKDATHAFIMPNIFIPYGYGCEHVHSTSNVLNVLSQADAIYDFSNYDYDNDGYIDVHFTSINIIGSHNGGVTGCTLCYYTTNDTNTSGNHIILRVNRQTRGSNTAQYFGVFFHESGHSLFSFPDMDHSVNNDFNHYGIGGFDVMSGGGFQGASSLYNPWFRQKRNWFTPNSITSNGTQLLQDFQTSGHCYEYIPGSLPGNSIPNEKFYISYHKPSPSNYFYDTWPYKDRNLGGVIVWHVKKDNPSLYDNYSDYRKLDIDIESAHGKYIWQENSNSVINTGVENALIGRDSLEIRKIALINGYYNEIQGPYYLKDRGSASIFYTPGDGKNFTFYSNPNSNWYVNSSSENYAQSITSGFSMKNLRDDNGTIKADFCIDDYTISQNTTLSAGTWYINNSINVIAGDTLSIQPGTTLKFKNGSSLIVNGILNAIGTEQNPITFTSQSGTANSSWGTITLNGSGASGSTIKYANIKYGTKIEAINTSNITIQYCNIDTTYDGVRFNNSSGSILNNTITTNSYGHGIVIENGCYTVTCNDNVITKTNANRSGVGIYFGGGSFGFAARNDIYHWDWGIGTIWSSISVAYSPYNIQKNNRVRNSNTGLMVYRSSWSIFGNSQENDYMWNSISGNSYNAKVGTYYSTYESQLLAYGNWWGSYPPNISLFQVGSASHLYYDYALTSDPWAGMAKVVASNIENPTKLENISSVPTEEIDIVLYGNELRLQNKYIEAKDYFISYIKQHPDKQAAYVQLYNCYSKETADEIIKFFTSLPEQASKDHKLLLAYLYLKNGDYKNAKEVNNSIIAENPNTELATKANLNNVYIALYNEDNINEAITIFNDALNKSKLSTPMELSLVHDAIETYGNTYGKETKGLSPLPYFESSAQELNKQDGLTELEIPVQYELLGNYPNPFNPATTISYALPYQSSVELIIYDIMGREVKSFAVPSQSAGYNKLVWDGRNENGNFVTSGVYFYKISIKSLENNGTFVKTAKLMMLK